MNKKTTRLPPSPNSTATILSKNVEATLKIKDEENVNVPIGGDRQTVYKHLLTTLRDQIEIATENYKHFTNMGDINNATK